MQISPARNIQGKRKRLINVDEYHAMARAGIFSPKERVELVYGELIDMSPIGSKHSYYVSRFHELLQSSLQNQARIISQNPVRLNATNEPEPDVSIVKLRGRHYLNHHPGPKDVLLLIEVSDSTLEYDKGLKLDLYAQFEIPTVWIFDVEKEQIEVFRSPENGKYSFSSVHEKKGIIELPFSKQFRPEELFV